jgi:RNA polymerase sigma-70 factor (ECF subfamily)
MVVEALTPEQQVRLLEAVGAGSERALREFYEIYHRRVYAFALSRLKDSTDAADVLNDVMFEVWRNARRFEGRSKVLTWVFGITYHKVIDRLRARGQRTFEEVDPQMADEDTPTAFDVVVKAGDAVIVRRCVDALPATHRAVVHLAFFEDLPYGEIARIVDCPEGTVKTRMLRAKQLLKDCVNRLSGDDPA